jgi:hypothetical protein
VAYSWAKHRQDLFELRTTPVRDGGSMRVVATMSAGAFMRLHDWSKDGKWIVVERGSHRSADRDCRRGGVPRRPPHRVRQRREQDP